MTHDQLVQAMEAALIMNVSGLKPSRLIEDEWDPAVVDLAVEVEELVLENSDTQELLVHWAEYVLESHNQGFEESYGGVKDFVLYMYYAFDLHQESSPVFKEEE